MVARKPSRDHPMPPQQRVRRGLADEIFSAVVENAFDSILIVAHDGTIAYANPACGGIFGARPAELIGKNVLALVHPDDAGPIRATLARLTAPDDGEPPATLEARFRHHDDHWLVTENVLIALELPDSRGVVFNSRDVSEKRRADALLRGRTHLLERIATTAPLEQVLAELLLLVESQADGIRAGIVLFAVDNIGGPGAVRQAIAPSLPMVARAALERHALAIAADPDALADGRPRVDDLRLMPAWDGNRDLAEHAGLRTCWTLPIRGAGSWPYGVVALFSRESRSPTDTERALAEMTTYISRIAIERDHAMSQVQHMAHHDALTGLPNRNLLHKTVADAIAHARAEHRMMAVMFIDLDHFKIVNDTLGHHVGDRLLQVVAARLHHCLRQDDSVARLGGDEFVITLHALNNAGEASLVAGKVLAALQAPFSVDNHELHIGASIGIGVYPHDGQEVDLLMKAADHAMYAAKSSGRNNAQFYTPGLDSAMQRRQRLVHELRHALQRGEFSLLYQPQVDMRTRRIRSAEALLRWTPAEHAVSPAEFIPIAEESGLILAIGEWVLGEACRQLRAWHDAGHTELAMAVNLSMSQVLQLGFADRAAALLHEAGLRPSDLLLEISEKTLMQPGVDNIVGLRTLCETGIRLSVDNFGNGPSNLSGLQRVPLHVLKIAPAFVQGIGSQHGQMDVISAIIALARSLHLDVIAEGVETGEQAAYLRDHGCPVAQGYFYGKPVSAEQFTAYLGRPAQQ
jgi:diguanylate cyclase (GGDEF)-like protein/PAS domain S-box-containing protein